MTDNSYEVDKPGDPYHRKVGQLVEYNEVISQGIVRFDDGAIRRYPARELRAVIRICA